MTVPDQSSSQNRGSISRDVSIRSYAAFVTTYWALLLFMLILGLVIGFALHLMSPLRYTSTAHMVIVATTVSGADETQTDVSMDSALQLLRSDQVIGEAARSVEYPGGSSALNRDLTTRPIINSRILRVSVAAVDAESARRAVTAVTDRFFEVRRQGLEAAASTQEVAVEAQLDVVDSELARQYRLSADVDDTDSEQGVDEQEVVETAEIRRLVRMRGELHGEKAYLAMSSPDPGYLSRPPTDPIRGGRSGLAITVTSTATLFLLAGITLGAMHQRNTRHAHQGQHRPQQLIRSHV